MDKIETFINRMRKLNIDIKLMYNFPYIYLAEVNGKSVTETHYSDYAFTIAFLPVDRNKELHFLDIGKMFEVIRKCCDNC